MVGADYVDQEGVSMATREYSAIPLAVVSTDGTSAPTGSLVIPNGRFDVPDGNALGLPPGIYTRVPGATGQAASDWRADDLSETFNYAPYTYLQTPNERGSNSRCTISAGSVIRLPTEKPNSAQAAISA